MSKRDKKQKEKQAMNTEEIRALREEERINSVFPEQSQSGKLINNLLVLLASLLTAAVVIVGLFYLNRLTSFMNAYALPYLWMIDDSSGFMTELLHCAIRLLFVLVICVLFGFALDINFSSVGRPKEVWQKHVNWCMLTAFGSDVLLMLISRIFGGRAAGVSGSLFSQVMYYITKLAVVPFTNIMLYLVIPSAIIKIVVTLVSNSADRSHDSHPDARHAGHVMGGRAPRGIIAGRLCADTKRVVQRGLSPHQHDLATHATIHGRDGAVLSPVVSFKSDLKQ